MSRPPSLRAASGAWRNWGRSALAFPTRVVSPASEDELCSLLAAATAQGRRVKVVGGSHSFSEIAVAEDIQVSLERLQGLTRVNPVSGLVSMRGGTFLWTLAEALEPYGLALPNMGDIDRQSIAGALSTGTHGTGLAFTGYAGLVEELRVALASGDVVTASRTLRPELFEAARVGLGAVGVLLEVTLRCVPSFDLAATERTEPLEATIEGFAEESAREDHLEFFWFQHTGLAAVKRNRRVEPETQRTRANPLHTWIDAELLGNAGHRALCEVGRVAPRTVPSLNRLAARAMGGGEYCERSDRVFVSPRRTRFREMEYAIALEDFAEVFREVRRAVDHFGEAITFPLEVRSAAADDTWLGTASGRASAYIAAHRFVREDPATFFAAVEPILREAGGRPHWGKLHTLGAAELRGRYPHFDDFLAVRSNVDPHGTFLNPYLRRVLGI